MANTSSAKKMARKIEPAARPPLAPACRFGFRHAERSPGATLRRASLPPSDPPCPPNIEKTIVKSTKSKNLKDDPRKPSKKH